MEAKITKDEARANTILGKLEPGDTVFTSLEWVNRNGDSRVIQLHIFRGDARNPNHYVLGYIAANLLGMKYDSKRGGVKIGGGGMDMGFALVYDLGRVLFGDGYALKQQWL